MRILFDFQNSSGGAPRSQLEHAKALSSKGHEIFAVIDGKENNQFFNKTNFKVFNLPTFGKKNYIERVLILKRYYDLIKKIKPDLLCTNRTTHVYFLSLLSDITGVPILCARAGGSKIPTLHKANIDRVYILYSEENYNAFRNMGFPKENLFIIKNRIESLDIKNNAMLVLNEKFNILIVGNIKKETIKGLIWIIKQFVSLDKSIKIKYTIKIAGAFIGLSKIEEYNFNSIIGDSNKKMQNGEIIHLGWIDDLNSEIEKSNICLGKGRSVIQPLMAGKCCYVLSEMSKIFHCNELNFNQLSSTNFSGRGLNLDNDLFQLIESMNANISLTPSENLISLIRKEYSVENLGNNLDLVLQNIINRKNDKNMIKAFKRYLKFMYYSR